ncbi:MAG: GNAT family N-acetyltransferase [Vicinamibacterales bacterium]
MSLTVRKAAEKDLPTLGRLGASLMRLHYGLDERRFLAPGEHPEGGYAWFLGSQLSEPDVVVLVAERDDAVVGYIYAGLEPLSWKELRGPAGFIHDVVVDPQARHAGVATALIDAALAWLGEEGAPRVVLWTAEQNVDAQRLFAARGFRRTMIEMTREL